MINQYKDASVTDVDEAMKNSWTAFQQYKKLKLFQRADLMMAIARELENNSEDLIATAAQETYLEIPRLQTELKRAIFQLNTYSIACRNGSGLDIKIDTADNNRVPPKPDIRKMLVPLGPVVVFGASNFPFAYSTAGGDTACALAAGCTVVVKAHPAHPETSEKSAAAIAKAIKDCLLPENIFIHLHGSSFETGKALVQHPFTKAVGFTGSLQGGRALFDLAASRPVPIPVFAEMGSVNPVFLLPEKLQEDMSAIVKMFTTSITNSAGQFCTNPGLFISIDGEILKEFEKRLGESIVGIKPQKMLHKGIAESFVEKRNSVLAQEGVTLIASGTLTSNECECITTLASVQAENFLENHLLHQEVFGSFSLMVKCKDENQMLQVAGAIEGQLTATLIASEEEVSRFPELVETLSSFCGRFIWNSVPTGVAVTTAMHHGGPYPATTDSRFTAVGADGIKRFARPLCLQNWKNELLPEELRIENPLGLCRTVNGIFENSPKP